jgi:chemotaxis protein MotB
MATPVRPAGRSSGPPRRKRAEEHEEHEDSERWLVTYADMLTLLCVLFIILFSMSSIDKTKYQELKNSLAAGFGHSAQILSGSSPLLDDQGATSAGSEVIDTDQMTNLPAKQAAAVRNAVSQAVNQAQQQADQRTYADAEAHVKSLLQLWHRMQSRLAAKGLADDVQATIDERGLVVSLVSKHVVFEPNVATLSPRGQQIVDTIAPVIATIKEPIEIDGHTNQVKVKPKYYPTDWELSTARADSVLRRLNEIDNIPDRRLRETGFGHTKPLIDPSTPGSQKLNKRVDVVVLSQAPAETRALYEQVQTDLQKSQQNQTTGDQP